MKRSRLVAGAAVVGAATVTSVAFSAPSTTPKQIGGTANLGVTTTPVAPPVCPTGVSATNCTIILTRATGLETIRDGATYPTTIKQAGTLVAFTVGLAQLSTNLTTAKSEIQTLDSHYGGTSQIQLAVLKSTSKKKRTWQVAAQSPVFHVQPYLGYTTQFALTTPITVTPGEVVAMTVPTWAPILSYDLPTKKFAYRQSRRTNCNRVGASQNAQLTIGQSTNYTCDYPGTRIEYSATEIVTPIPPKNYIH